MASFTARITKGATIQAWVDPASGSLPSRINAQAVLHRYHATVGSLNGPFTLVEIAATIGGVEGPLDGTLGGDLFVPFFIEKTAHPINVSSPIGQSSIQRFVPPAVGHYTFAMARQSGDAVIIHIDSRIS